MVSIFVFTSVVFVLYDLLVERRNKVVTDTAIKSATIVSSLFPNVVRDRLYEDEENKKERINKSTFGIDSQVINFLQSDPVSDHPNRAIVPGSKPIANLYPDCTVLFADLVGFTSWSSERSPEDVFTLLERLFGAFDAVANKLGVFKVETIGDCYLAVTGLSLIHI